MGSCATRTVTRSARRCEIRNLHSSCGIFDLKMASIPRCAFTRNATGQPFPRIGCEADADAFSLLGGKLTRPPARHSCCCRRFCCSSCRCSSSVSRATRRPSTSPTSSCWTPRSTALHRHCLARLDEPNCRPETPEARTGLLMPKQDFSRGRCQQHPLITPFSCSRNHRPMRCQPM